MSKILKVIYLICEVSMIVLNPMQEVDILTYGRIEVRCGGCQMVRVRELLAL
jgi:hypothetical protein